MNRNLMLSIDVIPIPTDEAVQEVEKTSAWRGDKYHKLAETAKCKQ